MRALNYVAPGKLEWHEAKDPKIEGPLQAVVRPIASAPCDLDRAIIAGKTPLPGPFALGHECVAEVAEIGEGVRGLSVGDVVVVPWHINCGECGRCKSGLTASCEKVPPRAMYGTQIGGDFGGLFSDLVHVPYADAMLIPVPTSIAPATVASASDNLTDAFVAVSRALNEYPGARVLVVGGAGGISLYAVEMALALGASSVDYVDRSEDRLALAMAMGAKAIPRAETITDEYPIVVDASANPAELMRAVRALGPGGHCVSLGVYFMDTPLPLLDMYAKDVTFRIGRCSVGPHIKRVLSLVAQGRVHPERVTQRVADWEDMIEVLTSRAMKPVLVRKPIHGRA